MYIAVYPVRIEREDAKRVMADDIELQFIQLGLKVGIVRFALLYPTYCSLSS